MFTAKDGLHLEFGDFTKVTIVTLIVLEDTRSADTIDMAGSSTFTWAHALQLHSSLSPFESPLPGTHAAFADVKPVSWKRMNIAGILVTVYGMQELPSDASDVTCLWLLHGRGDTQDSMAYTAASLLNAWNGRRQYRQKGLICICFDQRNHGSRMIDDRANVSWKQGNPTHGQDMFNLYSGTASDLSVLITQTPQYLPFKISEHLCAGVSLGGHATWQILVSEPRVTAGIVVIGCPDYVRLMTDRAIRSELPTTTDSDPPGRNFLGSNDFPASLISSVEAYDPAGVFLSELDTVTGEDHLHIPSVAEQARLRPLLNNRLGGKKILVMGGGKDKLVPPACGEPFLTWLKKAVDPVYGWSRDSGVEVEDIIDPEARHEFSARMRKEAERWVCEVMAGEKSRGGYESKM